MLKIPSGTIRKTDVLRKVRPVAHEASKSHQGLLRMSIEKTPKSAFDQSPRPVRAEWEQTINALRPWLSPEKFRETEAIHWRMFERANNWFERDPKAKPSDRFR